MNCICDQYEDEPCRRPPTQEDLLCDDCRVAPDHGYVACALLSGFNIPPTHVRVPQMLNMMKEMGIET